MDKVDIRDFLKRYRFVILVGLIIAVVAFVFWPRNHPVIGAWTTGWMYTHGDESKSDTSRITGSTVIIIRSDGTLTQCTPAFFEKSNGTHEFLDDKHIFLNAPTLYGVFEFEIQEGDRFDRLILMKPKDYLSFGKPYIFRNPDKFTPFVYENREVRYVYELLPAEVVFEKEWYDAVGCPLK